MDTRVAAVATLLVALIASTESRQRPVDLSGAWIWDAARSDHRAAAETMVVAQSATELAIHATLCCRQAGEQWVTIYHFNRWGSRNATPANATTPPRGTLDTKPTQARWDGETLVMHAGPDLDSHGGSVRIWRLSADGSSLIEEIVNRGLGRAFDFRAASIPAMYTRDRHVYQRRVQR